MLQQARLRAGRSLLQRTLAIDILAIDGVGVALRGQVSCTGSRFSASRQLHSGWGLSVVPLSARPLIASARTDELIAAWLREHRRAYSSEQSPLTPPRVGAKLSPGSDKDEKVRRWPVTARIARGGASWA